MKDKKYFAILHYGGFAGNAEFFTQEFFSKNNLTVQNIYKLKLPESFLITNTCNGCGYCKDICPAKNIIIEDKKLQFKGECVSCLACYQRCPEMSINYGEKTIGRKRYWNPNVDFSKMK